MGSLITKFTAGWLNSDAMNAYWLYSWYKKAKKAKRNNRTLIVFEIPNDDKSNFPYNKVFEIEKLLQERFPDESIKI